MFSCPQYALPRLYVLFVSAFSCDSFCLHFESQPWGSPSVFDAFVNPHFSCVYNMDGSIKDHGLLSHHFILNGE